MGQKECIAMILAGGKGVRLGALTNDLAKPAIHFGGKYRIIDFTLSNCKHSGIDTLGVLTQYQPLELHEHIGNGQAWDLNRTDGGVFLLPSYKNDVQYMGTADAVYQNIKFIDSFNPECVLILSGDHIYKMNYQKMLQFHKKNNADATIAVITVPWEEASRFGIMNTAQNSLITEFTEKPAVPKSNLASMGIYVFNWNRLKRFLIADSNNIHSQNDFGKNIIPLMLSAGENLYAYKFHGYWRDVGTIQSLWESNMDLIQDFPEIDLYDQNWEILTKTRRRPPCCMSGKVDITRSIIAEGCKIGGKVENSVLFDSVFVGEGAEVIDSIIMPGAFINENARIYKAIIGEGAVIDENVQIGANGGINIFYDNKICSKDISLVGPGIYIDANIKIRENSHINRISPPKERPRLAVSQETFDKNPANLELMYV